MKKNTAKKLALAKETLRQLNGTELDKAAAAAWSDDSVCPTVNPSRQCPQ